MVGRTQPPESSTGIAVRCSRRRITSGLDFTWHPHHSAPKRAPRPARASRASCARPAASPPSSTVTRREPQALSLNTRELESSSRTISAGSTVVELVARRRDHQDADPRDPASPVQEARSSTSTSRSSSPARRSPSTSRSCSSARPRACASAARCSSRSCTASRCSSIRRTSRTTSTSTSRNLAMGHSLHVRDLKLPAGVEVLTDEDATVCAVIAPRAVVEEAAAEAEAARRPSRSSSASRRKRRRRSNSLAPRRTRATAPPIRDGAVVASRPTTTTDEGHPGPRQSGQGIRAHAPQRRLVAHRPPRRPLALRRLEEGRPGEGRAGHSPACRRRCAS